MVPVHDSVTAGELHLSGSAAVAMSAAPIASTVPWGTAMQAIGPPVPWKTPFYRFQADEPLRWGRACRDNAGSLLSAKRRLDRAVYPYLLRWEVVGGTCHLQPGLGGHHGLGNSHSPSITNCSAKDSFELSSPAASCTARTALGEDHGRGRYQDNILVSGYGVLVKYEEVP